MKDRVVNYLLEKIKKSNESLDAIKIEEIRYGLIGVYTMVSKTSVILAISIILGFFKKFIVFLFLYGFLRSVGFGTHAKSNLMCWIFSTVMLLGIPYIFTIINISNTWKIFIWIICFVNFLIFCPADTDKRPMINKMRKLKFKFIMLIISLIYLALLFKVESASNLVLASMVLEALLTNPLGYILMGQKVRFRLNDINIFNLK